MKLRSRLLLKLVLGLSAGAACAAIGACSTSDAGDDSAAGSGGTSTGGTGTAAGGSGNAAGTVATGGGSGGAGPMGTACPKAMNPLLSDFSMLDGGGGDPSSWGDFTSTFSGSSFVYPNGTATYPLTADFSKEDWHITGTVGDYSGFGLVFGGCNLVDASMFSGISFSIKGSVPIAGALADTVQMIVATAADDPASAWLNAHKMAGADDKPDSFGTCMPVNNQYDGTCNSPTYTVPVTATATTINVKWSDLKGGKPLASPDPMKITSIAWVIPTPAGLGGAMLMTYMVDLTIDDLKFLP